MLNLDEWRNFLLAEKLKDKKKHGKEIARNLITLSENEFSNSINVLITGMHDDGMTYARMQLYLYGKYLRYGYLREAMEHMKQKGSFLVYTPVISAKWDLRREDLPVEKNFLPDSILWYESSVRTIAGSRKIFKHKLSKVSGDRFSYGRNCFPLAKRDYYEIIKKYELKFSKIRKSLFLISEIKSKLKSINNLISD